MSARACQVCDGLGGLYACGQVRTANAVMVFNVLGLISDGMKARMKFGTLWEDTVHRILERWLEGTRTS